MKIDIERGMLIVEAYGLKIEPLLFNGKLGHIEHFTHEVSHGISLGIPIEPGFEHVVSNQLALMDDEGVEEEALVLATEFLLFKWLGHEIEMGDLEDAARIQCVPLIELREKLSSFRSKDLAHRVLAWMRTQGVVT